MERTSEGGNERQGAATRPSTTDLLPTIVHPGTGELLEPVDTVDSERLAEFWVALKEAELRVVGMRRALDDELRYRLDQKQRSIVVVGGFEIRVEGGNESVWDADELEGVLRAAIEDGTLDARECTDVIRHETRVSRSDANRLLDRLSGDIRSAVERCRSWKPKGRPAVRVERSIELPSPDAQSAALKQGS